ncbi:MAG: integrase repeat-containing protein [Planctomycetota bacterium]
MPDELRPEAPRRARRGGSQRHEWRPFKEARDFARSLGLKSFSEWRLFAKGKLRGKGKRPHDVPANPHVVYATEWRSVGDWLGTGRVSFWRRTCRPFKAARAFARGLGLTGRGDWEAFCRGELAEKGSLPPDIPMTPRAVYPDEWKGFSDFLGYRGVGGPYRSFEAGRRFARSLGFTGYAQWIDYVKGRMPEKAPLPADVPSSPHRSYAKEWKGYPDWLGLDRSFLPFAKARRFARSVGLRTGEDWRRYCRGEIRGKLPLPARVPRTPQNVYAEDWAGMADWLGVEPEAAATTPVRPARLLAIVRWIRGQRGRRAASHAIAARFWLRRGELAWVIERLVEDYGAELLRGVVVRRRGTVVVLPRAAVTARARPGTRGGGRKR